MDEGQGVQHRTQHMEVNRVEPFDACPPNVAFAGSWSCR